MKKLIAAGLTLGLLTTALAGCSGAEAERAKKDAESDKNGGLERVVKVYDHNNNVLATYEGLIDIDSSDGDSGRVKFDLDGKRHIIYGGIVIVDEK